MKYDVFICYRRDGGEHLAARVKDALQVRGLSAFIDVEGLKGGKFNTSLLEKIEEAVDAVVILTPGSLDRCVRHDDWFRQEIAHAIKHKRNIVPVLARGFHMPSPDELSPDIAELVTYNGLTPTHELFDESMTRLVSKLLLSGASLARNGPVVARQRILRSWMILLVLVFIVLFGGKVALQHSKSWLGDLAIGSEPSASTNAPPDIVPLIRKYDGDRPAKEKSLLETLIKKGGPPKDQHQLVLAAQVLIGEGRFLEAYQNIMEAIRLRFSSKDPHFVLGELYYKLFLFDAFNRGKCVVNLRLAAEMSASEMRGYLSDEIHEMIGSQALYVDALSRLGIDDREKMRVRGFALSYVTDEVSLPKEEVDKLLAKLGRAERIPVPFCSIDGSSKAILVMAKKEFDTAKMGDETPKPAGLVFISQEKVESYYQRIVQLLAN